MGEGETPKEPTPTTKTNDTVETVEEFFKRNHPLGEVDMLREVFDKWVEFQRMRQVVQDMTSAPPKPNVLKHFTLTVGSGDDERVTISFDLREKSLDKYIGFFTNIEFMGSMVAAMQTASQYIDMIRERKIEKSTEPSTFPWSRGTRVRVKVPEADRNMNRAGFKDLPDGLEGFVHEAYSWENEGIYVEVDFGDDGKIMLREKDLEVVPDTPTPSKSQTDAAVRGVEGAVEGLTEEELAVFTTPKKISPIPHDKDEDVGHDPPV